MTLPTRLTAADILPIQSAVRQAALQLRLGTADDDTRDAIHAAINVAYQICKSTQRHAHLMPVVMAASDAALAGHTDIDALDDLLQVYLALLKTTPRKAIVRAINRAIRENS